MGEIKFKFYGKYQHEKSLVVDFLFRLNLVEFLEETYHHKGLYAIERRYGKEIFRKVSELGDLTGRFFVLYKYLNTDELDFINKLDTESVVYVLNHKMIDSQYFEPILYGNAYKFKIILQNGTKGGLRSESNASAHELLYIKPSRKKEETVKKKKSLVMMPLLFINVVKFLVSPIVALKQYTFILKILNSRLVERAKELVAFVLFLSKFIASKVYGIFVDLYYVLERYLKLIYNIMVNVYYFFEIRIKNVYYGLVKAYYFVEINSKKKYFGYILPFYYSKIHSKYFVIYDMSYRAVMWAYAFVKLVVFYPFRKSYWFLEFQYNKRIKKSNQYDRN